MVKPPKSGGLTILFHKQIFVCFVLLVVLRSQQLDFVVLHHAFAIHTAERLELVVEHLHLGWDRLMVGDALWVAALYNADDLLWILHVLLLYDLVVLDDVERDVRRNDREAADLLVGDKAVGNLDDTLLAEGLRFEVGADGDGAWVRVKIKDLYDLEGHICGYMVDDGAVLDGADFEFGFL